MNQLWNNGSETDRLGLSDAEKAPLAELLRAYAALEDTVAVAIGGSLASGEGTPSSDMDIYVFVRKDLPAEVREKLIKPLSSRYETGGDYFGPGDEFLYDAMNRECDVMYWSTAWFTDTVKSSWERCQPQNGYTTAFLYTLKNFVIVYDTDGWLASLRDMVQGEYPEDLMRNIVSRNLMLMKDKPFSSYYEQIEKAVRKNDLVSVNHRIAAFLASYFDALFAMNRIFHPGEKRQVSHALKYCSRLPADFRECLDELLGTGTSADRQLEILERMFASLKKVWQEIQGE
ncbi:DUF4037 domain-containing protein [Succinimonas sp.]|uniref:DUF4037 domain-containing protein n=1 Tax=Succinimonas sp. TaxID=1936151 RepID=UPI0038671250